ncbi:MAG: hypothetical protein ACI9DC_001729 [Gammaproteobacteria bacterium]|jgi:hypothetical protein
MKRLLLVAVLLWPVGAVAYADFVDGFHLQDACADSKLGEPNVDPLRYKYCVKSLRKVFFNTLHLPGTCAPTVAYFLFIRKSTLSDEQRRKAWLDYTNAHLDDLSLPAVLIANRAFKAAWPCKR